MAKSRLRTSMVLWLWGTSAVIFLAMLVAQFLINKAEMEKDIRDNAINLSRYYGKRLDAFFNTAAMIPTMEAAWMETDPHWDDRDALKNYLQKVVEVNPRIYGACIALEPDAKTGNRTPFCAYYYYDKGTMVYKDLSGDPYRYWEWEWYQSPKKTGKSFWTNAYYDRGGGNTIMISYAHPFYRNNRFAGVVSVDVSLSEIAQDINRLRVLKTGYGFLLSEDGSFLTYPSDTIPKGKITSLVPTLTPEMDSLASLPTGDWVYSVDLDPLRNEPCWIILRPVRNEKAVVGSVVFIYPIKELYSSLIDLQFKTFFIGAAGLAILLFVIIIIANNTSRPIVVLSKAVGRAATGELESRIGVTAKNLEVMALQTGFNKMLDDLKLYIKNLRDTTALNERIESELKIAQQIQTGMLPRIFPPFPDRKDIDIYAMMDPAKEVGGDFYDFFLIDENRLCFLVGDVSGKGVPAALFMMINKVLLKNEGMGGGSPDQILSKVNNIISDDNEELMFVTLFCVVLDLTTGELNFANAGHNPPLIGTAGAGFEYLHPAKNFVLGVKPNVHFVLNRGKLDPGDVFFIYTDGVTEAMDTEGKLYGEKRLQQTLNASEVMCPRDLIGAIRSDLKEYAQGADQSDDITMLAVKYFGPAGK